MCENNCLEKCYKCGRYSIDTCHGYSNKPMEDIIECIYGGVKKWKFVNNEWKFIGGLND